MSTSVAHSSRKAEALVAGRLGPLPVPTGTRLHHGGRLDEASARFGRPAAGWLDLSTGLNPHGWPVPPVPAVVWQRLPDDALVDRLAEACCEAYGAPAALPVAGTQAALQTLPWVLPQVQPQVPPQVSGRLRPGQPIRPRDAPAAPWRVRVRAGSYAEHAQAWQRAGHTVDAWRDERDIDPTDERPAASVDPLLSDLDEVDVLLLVNPDNPSGARVPAAELLAAHARLAARGGWLVVDEAYLDALAPAEQARLSLAPYGDRPGLVVLRSVGKFYGLAGARIGAVLAAAPVRAALADALGPWSVPGPSAWVATAALHDRPWAAAMRERLAAADARLAGLLRDAGLDPHGGPLYRTVWTPAAPRGHAALARTGIWTRLFEPVAPGLAPAWRFGLPGDEDGWQRLADALARRPLLEIS